jgi:AsmA protein
MKKIISITIAAAAIIALILVVFIKIYVTPERIKTFLLPYAEESLNRKITVGEIKISLLKGIDVKDFAVKEADEKSDFVKCRDFILKFQLLPLLSRKVVIDEIMLISPELKIARDNKGMFNFEGLGKKEAPDEVKKEKKAAEANGLPISLLVNNITVKDLRFSFIDATKALPDIKGTIAVNAGIKSADGSLLSSKGDMELTLDEVILQGPLKKQIKNISAALKYAADIDPEAGNIHIDEAALKIQGIPVSISGDVKNFKKEPEVDIAVSVPKFKTADLMKEVSAFVDLKGLALSGNVSADLKLKGILKRTESLKADGLITLDQTGILYKDINTILDGNLKFSEQTINIDIKGTAGKNTARIKGSVSSYFKDPDIKLDLYSKQLSIDELIPSKTAREPKAKDSEASVKAGTSPSKTTKETEPLALKMRAEGEVKIDSAVYKGMTMTDFHARYKFRYNRFEIIKMTAVAGKGRINIDSIIDLSKKGYWYSLSCSADSIHADEIVNALFPKAKDTVYGVLSLNLKMDGAGTLPENVKKNLVADGDFNITDGKMTNAKITDNLSRFLNVDELKTINLRKAKGTVKIRDRNARLKSIFTSDDIEMNPSGDIGLDETLNLAFDLKLSPRLTKKTAAKDITKYIKNEEGWSVVPLKVSGTLSDPSYNVDVAKAGKKVIDKEINKFLDKLFKKKQ